MRLFASAVGIILACAFVSGCNFSHSDKLVGPYAVFSLETITDSQIVTLNADGSVDAVVIPEYVFAIGSDQNFIIAKRNIRERNSKAVEFYIIRVTDRQVFGGLSEDEFDKRRVELNVPTGLKFTVDTSTHGSGGLV